MLCWAEEEQRLVRVSCGIWFGRRAPGEAGQGVGMCGSTMASAGRSSSVTRGGTLGHQTQVPSLKVCKNGFCQPSPKLLVLILEK